MNDSLTKTHSSARLAQPVNVPKILLAVVTIQTLLNLYPAGLSTGFSVLRWGLRWKSYSSVYGMNSKPNEHRSPLATNRTGRKRSTCTKSFLDPQYLDILGQIISSRFIPTKADFHGHPSHKCSLLHEKARELFIWNLVLSLLANVLVEPLSQSNYRKLYIQFWLWTGLTENI